MQYSQYHSLLRIGALTFALLLLFSSGLLAPVTTQLTQHAGQYVASAIGMTASVQPTELNEFTAELTAKEQDLNAREAGLAEREIQVGLRNADGTVAVDTTNLILSAILFVLLVLIVLNYALDFIRYRQERVVVA